MTVVPRLCTVSSVKKIIRRMFLLHVGQLILEVDFS